MVKQLVAAMLDFNKSKENVKCSGVHNHQGTLACVWSSSAIKKVFSLLIF